MRKRKNNAFDTKSRYFSLVIFVKKSYKITESAKLKNIKVTVEHYFDVLYLNNGTEKIRSHGSVVKLPPPPQKRRNYRSAIFYQMRLHNHLHNFKHRLFQYPFPLKLIKFTALKILINHFLSTKYNSRRVAQMYQTSKKIIFDDYYGLM